MNGDKQAGKKTILRSFLNIHPDQIERRCRDTPDTILRPPGTVKPERQCHEKQDGDRSMNLEARSRWCWLCRNSVYQV